MSKYKIAWMPGDGVGNDVMEAARIVLDRMKLDAEYVPCDIGWEFWCKEGNALPDRTVKALKETTCGLFGAITSKPQSEAKEELAPELKDKGLVYFSPIVGLRQMFNLHTNMRPCKSYPGNPLNYRGNKITNPSGEDVPIDQVVFRENTEGMYGGVEFFPLPESVYTALCANPKMKKWKDKAGLENIALSTRIMSVQGCTNICKEAFEFAKKTGRKRVTLIEKPNVLRKTGGLMTRCFRDVAKGYPDIWADEVNIDAICMWMFKNPQDYSVLVAENMFGDIVSDLCAGLVGGLGFAPSALSPGIRPELGLLGICGGLFFALTWQRGPGGCVAWARHTGWLVAIEVVSHGAGLDIVWTNGVLASTTNAAGLPAYLGAATFALAAFVLYGPRRRTLA